MQQSDLDATPQARRNSLIEPAAALLQTAFGSEAILRRLLLADDQPNTALQLSNARGVCVDFRLRPWSSRRVEEGGIGTSDLPTVWVLKRGPASLRQELREAGVSFVDLSGAVHLDLPGLLVDRSDLEPVRIARAGRGLVDPFADRSSLVSRLLLSAGGRSWGVRELARAAGVNPSTVSRVVHGLAEAGVVEFERVGRASEVRASDPLGLLDRWTAAYDWGENTLLAFDAPSGDPASFLPQLKRVLGDARWALSLCAGASLITLHADWRRIHFYIEGDEFSVRELSRRVGWRARADGWLVAMLPHYKQSVWWGAERYEGLPVVSVLQLILDLWHYPFGGREQAEQLLETRLRPIWESRAELRAVGDSPRDLLGRLKDGLAAIYGDRFEGLYAYGSYARGEQEAESDLDVVVVLDGVEHYASEVDRTGELISRLSLEYGVSISRVFVTAREWVEGDSAFLRNAREEAVPA